MAIVVQALCNLIMRPAKYIDYAELAASRVELDELNAFTARKNAWYKRDPLAKREKEDYKRFMSVVGKHIVFYSERSGFYKYFQAPSNGCWRTPMRAFTTLPAIPTTRCSSCMRQIPASCRTTSATSA